MDVDVQNKVVIVTGAARGLGREYVQRFAEAGARVVAADKTDCGETINTLQDKNAAIAINVDVTDNSSTQAMVDAAKAEFGRVDVVINNAALWGGLRGGRFEDLDESEWDACMTVNVKGIWNCCRAVVATMRANGGGSIVNIASCAAMYGMPYALHYTTSKGAVIALTRGLARELGRDWIRVNAIAPSVVLTEGAEEFFGEKHDRAIEVIKKGQSLQRNLEPTDIAGAVLFLAGDGSKYITGQTIMVDGGTHFL